MAETGGEANQGAMAYDTLTDLGPQIVGQSSILAACAIHLDPLGPGTTLVVSATLASGEVMLIPEDPTTGWSFTDSTDTFLALNGSNCDSVRDGTYAGLTIAYQCQQPVPLDTRRSPPAGR